MDPWTGRPTRTTRGPEKRVLHSLHGLAKLASLALTAVDKQDRDFETYRITSLGRAVARYLERQQKDSSDGE